MSLRWSPPIESSVEEKRIMSRCKKARLYVFLREHRHELFDEAFEQELIAMYPERRRGREEVAPALLAMATLLQAWEGLSDQDAVESAVFDLRWRMLLDTLGSDQSPFSQGALYNFRQRLMAHDLDRRLLERTVELARQTRGFGHTALRAAFDSSPLFGAGRVEDTFNLLGHAMRKVVESVASKLDVDFDEAARRAGVPLLTGNSVKAMLDTDWDDEAQKKKALERLMGELDSLKSFLERELKAAMEQPPIDRQWAVVQQIVAQDIEPDPDGGAGARRIRRGVAKERRISVEDGQMRHGRKSKSSRIDGYKRHLAVDVTTKLVLAAAVTPANRPEGEASRALFDDLFAQRQIPAQLDIDRAYLTADDVLAYRFWGTEVTCRAFSLRNEGRFTKIDFDLDFERRQITCPAGQSVPLVLGAVARFPKATCASCPQRGQCTDAAAGRSLAVHPEEQMLVELRARQHTVEGRANLRRRVAVEHGLANVGRSQGRRARYVGIRKNLYDVRRHGAVVNLHVAAAPPEQVAA
jgi:Transposase DDE domain/Transposase domain (DUF772)